MPTVLQNPEDYDVPILKALADFPGGLGQRKDVLAAVLKSYGDAIPRELRETKVAEGGFMWMRKADASRSRLLRIEFAAAPEPKYWQITEAGRDWLQQNPDATHISAYDRLRSAQPQPAANHEKAPKPKSIIAGVTLAQLERTRQSMPADVFSEIWGDIYNQLVAEERARMLTSLTDKDLLSRSRMVVRRIQDFLQGRGNENPKSETVCDWIFLCYTVELHREGAALWRYVNQDEVNPWQYERTAKFSAACRVRAGL